MTEEQARSTLEGLGLQLGDVEEQYIEAETEKVGIVISQDPEWGTLLSKGEEVKVTVTRELRMPEVTGMTREAAESALKEIGISIIEFQNTPTEDEDEVNVILSQDPPGGELISLNTIVKLEVGVEQKLVTVPDVVGDQQEDAEAALEDAGFGVSVQEEASSEVSQGRVIRQSPLATQKAMEGSTVTIWVSTGPSTVEVPDVRTESENNAKATLTDMGLDYTVVYQDTTDPAEVGMVIDQVPLPGAVVDVGYNVRIFVGRSP